MSNFVPAQAADIFGFEDPPSCKNDPFFPVLTICGRNKTSAVSCQEYTKECTLPDLVSMAGRGIIWLITLVLYIFPLIVMYEGAKLIWYKKIVNTYYYTNGEGKKVMITYDRILKSIMYFVLMLFGWIIVRTVIDIFQVDSRINTLLLDQNGGQVKARQFNIK
jgi:uncharacterized Tic20 family protein